MNSPPITIMPFEPRSARREHSDETVSAVLALHNLGKSHTQIVNYVKIPKSTVTKLIHWAARNRDEPYCKTKHAGRPPMLNARSQRALICHVERFPHDNLAALGTPFKIRFQVFSRDGIVVYKSRRLSTI